MLEKWHLLGVLLGSFTPSTTATLASVVFRAPSVDGFFTSWAAFAMTQSQSYGSSDDVEWVPPFLVHEPLKRHFHFTLHRHCPVFRPLLPVNCRHSSHNLERVFSLISILMRPCLCTHYSRPQQLIELPDDLVPTEVYYGLHVNFSDLS